MKNLGNKPSIIAARVAVLSFAAAVMMTTVRAQTAPKAEAAAVAPITLETFAAPPSMEAPELSPGGKWIAAKLSLNGKQLLAMVNIFDTGTKPTLLRLDNANVDVNWWNWVNDDWLLVGISSTENVQGDKWRVSRVLSIERATGKTVPLGWRDAAQNAANVIWTARDGTPRILLGIQNSIYSDREEFWPEVREFDVSTGRSKIVVPRRASVFYYYADASGNVRMGYGYDDLRRTSRLLYRSSGKGGFSVLDKANANKDESLVFPSMFLSGADQALTKDNSDGFDAVYELDLATMKQGKKLFGSPSFDVGSLIPNSTGDGLAGVRVDENGPRTYWLDPGLAKTQSDLDAAVGSRSAQITSWDRSMNQLLVHVGGPDQPGAYFFYSRVAGGTMTRLAFVNEQTKGQRFAPVKTIKYKARDGLEIPAILTLPKNRPAKDLPLIVLPHGGPGARDVEGWDWWAQFLAWRGYAVIQPNYRGSTGLGRDFEAKGEGEWGLKMQDDLNDAITHLAKEGIANPKRVCMAGGSYGGYAALRAAQRDGALYRCAISYAGVADIAAMSRYDSQTIEGNSARAYWKESAPNSSDVAPIKHAEDFSIPVLIMHGKLDLRVPVEQSRAMASKLKSAGKPHRYVEQPLGDHHFSRTEDRKQFLEEMDAFLRANNPPD
jgi:dipeptidyl aminopeptidase/acylaminoacyl peptidase